MPLTYIWTYSIVKYISIESKKTKLGVLTNDLCKLKVMKKINNIATPIAAEATIFHHFGPNMSSNCIKLYKDGF